MPALGIVTASLPFAAGDSGEGRAPDSRPARGFAQPPAIDQTWAFLSLLG